MADYRLETRRRDGTYLATLEYRNLQGEIYKNSKWPTIRWDMSLESVRRQLTQNELLPGLTEAWLYRDDVLIFAGPIWDGNISTKENKFSCVAEGLASYFDRRRIVGDYDSSAPLGQQAWNLINASQAQSFGGLGITLGATVPGAAPSARFKWKNDELVMITDALADLSEGDNGFDWEITPDRKFYAYYPRLSGKANARLEYGGNIKNYAVDINGKYMGNNVVIQGAEKATSIVAADSTSLNKYGLRHYVESNTGLKTQAQLDAFAGQRLALRREIRMIPQLTVSADVNPFRGDIGFGQVVRTVIVDGWVNLDIDMRCSGFQFTVDDHGGESFVLFLNDLREV